MLAWICVLGLIAIPIIGIAQRYSAKFILGVEFAVLFCVSIFQLLPLICLLPFWLLCIAAAVVEWAEAWRQRVITQPLMQWLLHQLPTLSIAERDALLAGGLWKEADVFRAQLNWHQLQTLSPLTLTAEEQHFLDNETATLCRMLSDWQIVFEQADLPAPVWDYILANRFLGMIIPKEYGGLAFSAYAHSCILCKIATYSMSAAISIMVPNSLGPAEFLIHYGTEAQKQHYLPRLAAGKEIPCFALTAPQAGSDASAIVDKGVVCQGIFDGKETLGIKLNWDKRYITLAPKATLMGIAFKLYDPEHLLGDAAEIGITFALLPTNLTGIEIGKRHYPSGMAFLNGPIRGKDVFIPLDYVLGGAACYGKGWQMMMECLAVGRGISLPAVATAAIHASCRKTSAYTQVRQQFKRSLSDFEGVALLLGRQAGLAYLAEAVRQFTLRAIDAGSRPSIATAITKYHLTELARQAVNHAMDIHAGKGIQWGPHNPVALLYQAIPTAITVEGANILTRNLIIFGQGAMRCHPVLADEIVAANADDLVTFDRLLKSHVGEVLNLGVRALLQGLSCGRGIQVPNVPYRRELQHLQRLSVALALSSELAFVGLGKTLKVSEALSARLGDVLSFVYMGVAVFVYAETEHKQDQAALASIRWSLQYCIAQAEIALQEFYLNFPHKAAARILQRCIFPWGVPNHTPSDRLTLELAAQLTAPSRWRDVLTRHSVKDTIQEHEDSRIEQAFVALAAAQDLLEKLTAAEKAGQIPRQTTLAERILMAAEKNLISAEERQQLETLDTLVWQALQVDEFEFNYFARKTHEQY